MGKVMETNRNSTERAVGKADVNGLGWWKWFFISFWANGFHFRFMDSFLG